MKRGGALILNFLAHIPPKGAIITKMEGTQTLHFTGKLMGETHMLMKSEM